MKSKGVPTCWFCFGFLLLTVALNHSSERLVFWLCRYGRMKPHPEMVEGPEAWERFQSAMQKVVAVPHSEIQKRIEVKWPPMSRPFFARNKLSSAGPWI